MKATFLEGLARAIGPALREYVQSEIAKATTPLRKQLADLEARPQVKYVGVFKGGERYQPGHLVTDHGSLWACLEATTARPPGAAWQLCVKRGGNGSQDAP